MDWNGDETNMHTEYSETKTQVVSIFLMCLLKHYIIHYKSVIALTLILDLSESERAEIVSIAETHYREGN